MHLNILSWKKKKIPTSKKKKSNKTFKKLNLIDRIFISFIRKTRKKF